MQEPGIAMIGYGFMGRAQSNAVGKKAQGAQRRKAQEPSAN